MTTAVTDFSQFTGLRASAERNDPAALRAVASQFEALFVQSLLKNMRGAELAEPMFGSDQMDMYQDMFDQQLSVEMASGRGIGLADMLVRQLGGEVGSVPATRDTYTLTAASRMTGRSAELPTASSSASHPAHVSVARPEASGRSISDTQGSGWTNPDEFVHAVWPHAERAAARLNVAPAAIVAQAALETGWGAHVMPDQQGGSSYNLFGIKAGNNWQGDSVAKPTLEYVDGIAQRRVEKFRAYPDVGAVFDDYATLIADKPRYAEVTGKGSDTAGFASALQTAGYATDPHYAEKLERVANGETLRQAIEKLKVSGHRPIPAEIAPVSD
ncbi:MAG: flagellar assembly peptidoglycan hydrolase FlgJ [Woeseia sp.]|nr:flagellar assembly peptidoglycan hydrolase FlgJ [Woeseia sp.]MBT8097932.1 flagellar assembly peptidoglycan hydrolase FlgJ [Woeseia sp.]NNE60048.1 flagellar assembly peptidoglycan hydrolase FlgJ [Woeseia sp.]NNL55517.1 flagellar assembly peptidoglycan hydrolase FlgJ [Woeseia sp.]